MQRFHLYDMQTTDPKITDASATQADRTTRQFDDAIALCRNLYVKKLNDYGCAWRLMRPSSLTDQLLIKADRIRSLETKGNQQVADESILDGFSAPTISPCLPTALSATSVWDGWPTRMYLPKQGLSLPTPATFSANGCAM